MPKSKPPYPPAFRAEAVQLVHRSDKSISDIAKDLGVADQTLRSWVQQAEVDEGLRDCATAEPDRLWVADITYVPTWAGFLSLAIVLDACSRRVVSWAMADHLWTELVVEAVENGAVAATARRGHPPLGSGQPVHEPRLRVAVA